MATAWVESGVRTAKKRRSRKPALRYEVNGRPVSPEKGAELALLAAQRVRQRDAERASQNRQAQPPQKPSPLATALQRLIDDVEAKLVAAIWTERCLPNGGSGGRCGIPYFHDRAEIFANAVAAGDWKKPHPGAPMPKAIDEMHIPLSWLSCLDRAAAELVHAAAGSKHGDPDANVSWGEVKTRIPAAREFPISSLQRRYEEGLTNIAMKVTFG